MPHLQAGSVNDASGEQASLQNAEPRPAKQVVDPIRAVHKAAQDHTTPRGGHAILRQSQHPPDDKSEAREIRTPNLLIWSQTRCRCAIAPVADTIIGSARAAVHLSPWLDPCSVG